jgi:hypothetical protein
MKTKVIEPDTDIKFPCLAKCQTMFEKASFVVLFSSNKCGTVVQVNDQFYCNRKLGFYSDSWTDIMDQNTWKILPPGTKVELIQE